MFAQALRRTAHRRNLFLTTALCGAVLLPTAAAAQDMGGFGTITSASGGVTANADDTTLNIGASGNGIVNWSRFDVPDGTTANFRNRNGTSAPTISILNRVTGGATTNVSGALNSDPNVNVYVINPNGVIFGAGARVNVGSLVASTLDVTDADFLDGDGDLHFSGPLGATTGITVASGATFNVPGNLVLLGGYVNTQAPVTAGGDLAFVAANDIVMQSSAGNPLKFVISRGTAVANAIRVKGDLKGKNVTLAMTTRSGVNNALLSIDGSIEATGVAASDSGIVLLAGRQVNAPTVTVAANAENDGIAAGITQQNGNLKSAAAVSVLTSGGISIGDVNSGTADRTNSTVSITGALDVIVRNIVSGHSVNVRSGQGAVRVDNISTERGDVFVVAWGLAAINGNVRARSSLHVSGDNVYLGSDDDAELFDIGGNGEISARTGAIYGGKGLTIKMGTLFNGDLQLTAATDILFDATSSILLPRTGTTSSLLTLSTGNAAGRIRLGDVTAVGIAGLTGRANHVEFGNLDLTNGLEVSTTQGSIVGGSIKTGGLASFNANGSIQLGAIDAASTVSMLAGGNITLNGDVTSGTTIGLTGSFVTARNLTTGTNGITVRSVGGDTTLGNLSAANGDITVNSGNGLTLGSLVAKNATLKGVALTLVNGSADIAGDYSVTGGEIRLGDNGQAVTQKAGGAISLTSTFSRIVGGAGLKLSSLGAMTLNAKSDIVFAADSAIQAGVGGAWRQVTLTTGAATDRIILGGVTANGITGLTGRQNSITLGNVAVVQPLLISTSVGDIVTGNLLIDQGASSIANSAGNITVGNVRSVNGTVTLSAAGDLVAGDVDIAGSLLLDGRNTTAGNVTARNGLAEIRAWAGNASFGVVTGNSVVIGASGTGGAGRVLATGINSRGDATINATGSVQFLSNVTVAGNANWTAGSIIIGMGEPMLMQVGGNTNLHATNGYVEIVGGAKLSTTGTVTMTAGRGPIFVEGDISARAVTLEADDLISLWGNITADTLTLTRAPATGARIPRVSQSAGILKVGRLSGSGLYAVTLKSANLIDSIGGFSAESISIANAKDLSIDGVIAAGDETVIRTTGNLTITQNGRFQGSNQDIALSANKFVNLAGSAVMASGARWRIFLQSPEGNDFGGLDSHDTAVWGKTIDSDLSNVAGNRYVFAFRPTLTFTSLDLAKTYGDDVASLLAGRYAVSGLHQGVAGAFLGDTLASAFSGAPLLSSLGSAANADVGGGSYAIDIGLGSLTSDTGYAFAFNNAGRLNVARKAITANVTANSKTYDGTTAATGQIDFTGMLAGDDLSGAANYSFADKNAGAGKTVSVTNFALSGADANNYTVTIPTSVLADILRKAVNITVAVDSKTYDGTTAATGRVSTSGVVAGDDFTVTGGAYAFGDKNAGAGKTVSVSGLTAGGADAGNYEFTIPTSVLADILRKAVTVRIAADGKVYDGTTAATGRITGIDGVLAGDDLAASGGTYAFADKNAGAGKQVSVTDITLSGSDAGNYEVTVPRSAIADIARRAVSANVLVDNKTYDGTTAATGRVNLSDIVAGDDVGATAAYAFGDKNAGAGKSVAVTNFAVSGADAGNYTIVFPASALADILRKAVNVTVAVDGKTYDGTTGATGRASASGVVAGDDVAFSGTYAFADKNAGAGKQVNVALTAQGADAGNYSFTIPTSVLADILRKAVTVRVAADDKTYDGTTSATGRVSGIDGVIAGDALTATGGSYVYSDKNAGAAKTVTVRDIAIGGADAGNYDVTIPTSVLATILRKALSITIAANGKTYDGTTSATGRVTGLSGMVQGDDVGVGGGNYAFGDRNAGQGKTVSASGFALSGQDAANYEIGSVASTTADIAKRMVTVRANDTIHGLFDRDPVLGYTVTEGSLAPGDSFTGRLTRTSGYGPGTYTITQGSLALSSNYVLNFLPGTLEIELGQLPSWLRAPSLYQTVELGGRAGWLATRHSRILWEPMLACSSPADRSCSAEITR